MTRISRSEALLYGDLLACFDHESGQRVIDWLRTTTGEGETITHEEIRNERIAKGEIEGNPFPIDMNALLLREGQRRAFRKLEAMLRKAQAAKGEL